jgi:hypothetical protein
LVLIISLFIITGLCKGITVSNDSDQDGISDDDEIETGTFYDDADTDDDGILDGNEKDWDRDTDGDGKINARDPDSDNDNIFDGTEMGIGIADLHPDTDIATGYFVVDEDNTTTTDPTNWDTDGDDLSDGEEDLDHDGKYEPEFGETDPLNSPNADSDNDGIPDWWEVMHGLDLLDPVDAEYDDDCDDLINLEEYLNGTHPFKLDTDEDGLPDGWEVYYSLDPVQSNDRYLDIDMDGFTNFEEYQNGTNPKDPSDFPYISVDDSDQDDLLDSWELYYFDSLMYEPHEDPDKDGYSNQAEYDHGTNPIDARSHPGKSIENSKDLDQDGILDLWELKFNFNISNSMDANYDTDSDGYSNLAEFQAGTDPRNKNDNPDSFIDNDHDQLPDSWEEFYGLSPSYEFDTYEDLDEDGYSNYDEYWAGTDPSDYQSYPIKEKKDSEDTLSTENIVYLSIGISMIILFIIILYFMVFSHRSDHKKYKLITEKPRQIRAFRRDFKPFSTYKSSSSSKKIGFDRNCIYCGNKLKYVTTSYGPQFWCENCNKYS